MNISRKTDYALRMLAMMVEDDNLLSVRAAADKVDVPYSFARAIQNCLMRADIIESIRGVRGGMRLKADPKEVTLRQVVEAIQGPLVMNDCTAVGGECNRLDFCCWHPIWVGAQELLRNYLDSISLYDAASFKQFPAVDRKFTDPDRFAEYASCMGGCLSSVQVS